MNDATEKFYSACRSALDANAWKKAVALCEGAPERFPEALASLEGALGYVAELARLEWAYHEVKASDAPDNAKVQAPEVNPTLRLLELSWRNLCSLLFSERSPEAARPEEGPERVLVWKEPKTGEVFVRPATDEDLLVLKMAVEGIAPEEVARTGELPVGVVERALAHGKERGLILTPPSLIRRDPEVFATQNGARADFLSADVFALQWHITQACDLRCLHCYDRSDRAPMSFETAAGVLEDLKAFCRKRNVSGQVTFSGGNPLLYLRFNDLYRRAVDMGFAVGILGNPTSRKRLEEILAISVPSFFQISFEGLETQNDRIRGGGYHKRAVQFLKLLKELGVYSMVMVTVTRDNIDDVIPLALELEGLTESFNFNRLSMVGEGAKLRLPERDRFISFLDEYLSASEEHPHMRLKDNLFNILFYSRGADLFDGCTGYGCGAAFNFITVLSDGEAHACRKFPSPIGNVFEQGIEGVYDSDAANRYRMGSDACRGCSIRAACGGCLSISHSFGLDIFRERDPFCFIDEVATNPVPSTSTA